MDIRNNYVSIEQIQGQYLANRAKDKPNVGGKKPEAGGVNSFSDIFESRLKFSKHADARLNTRNINLTDEQMGRLQSGMRKAGEKGINESLVLMDNLAFIVNVKNSTVITAMDSSNTDERIFTNIDGAVIV